MLITLPCVMYSKLDETGWWSRRVTFPCFPYPGLIVGANHVVKKVFVCQGSLDGKPDTTEVLMNRTGQPPRILESHGWVWFSIKPASVPSAPATSSD